MNPDLTPTVTRLLDQSTRHTSCVDGATTIWHSWGHGKPLLLLHGGSGSWTHWLRNIDAMVEAGHHVIVPDIPGFGDSDVASTGGGDAPGVIQPLWAGYAALFGEEPCQIIGFSFGAMVAVLMAVAKPDLAQSLLLVAPPGLGLRSPAFAVRSWKHLQEWSDIAPIIQHNLSLQMLHRRDSLDGETLRIHAHNLRRDRMKARKISQTTIVLESLPHLRCPVDAVYGRQDAFYLTGLSRLEGLLQSAPYFRELAWMDDCGHWTSHEDAPQFNAIATRMLSTSRY